MNTIPLSVPLILQETNSVECGLVCLKMLYDYYHIPVSLGDLRRDILLSSVGTYMPHLAQHLKRKGFTTEIIIHNPKIFRVEDKILSQPVLLRAIQNRLEGQEISERDREGIKVFITYLQDSGRLHVAIPTLKEIRQETNAGRPVIALVQNSIWYSRVPGRPFSDIFHLVVITGVDDAYVYINDPHWKFGGQVKHTHEEFLFALYSSSLGDVDNGSVIFSKI